MCGTTHRHQCASGHPGFWWSVKADDAIVTALGVKRQQVRRNTSGPLLPRCTEGKQDEVAYV
jgi:hypothetical protein